MERREAANFCVLQASPSPWLHVALWCSFVFFRRWFLHLRYLRFCSIQFNSDQTKRILKRSGKPICVTPCFSDVPPDVAVDDTVPVALSDGPWLVLVLQGPSRSSTPGAGWCDGLGLVPTGSGWCDGLSRTRGRESHTRRSVLAQTRTSFVWSLNWIHWTTCL